MPPPGKSSERPWSKHREPDIRNVEAVGSNPITSTKGQVTGLSGIPAESPSAVEHYVAVHHHVIQQKAPERWLTGITRGCSGMSARQKTRRPDCYPPRS